MNVKNDMRVKRELEVMMPEAHSFAKGRVAKGHPFIYPIIRA